MCKIIFPVEKESEYFIVKRIHFHGNNDLVARSPLRFDVSFNKKYRYYDVKGPFGIIACATDINQLWIELCGEIQMLWHEYAKRNPSLLTYSGQKLRQELLDTFDEVEK